MAWIANDDLDLLDKVFEAKQLIPTNRKGGLKLRQISFFYTNMKAITNVCKTLEKASMEIKQPHQYTEVLRKMGLLNVDFKLTKYGKMLLQVMYYDNNRIIYELSKPDINIDAVPKDISYIIEFFLFCVVRKCIDNPDQRNNDGINVKDIDSESINNLVYFFNNIIDTLNEPTNKNSNLNELFDFDNEDFYYTLQGMNFTGYEVKRLFRLPKDQIDKVWKLYFRILGEVKTIDESTLSAREKQYYDYANYYVKLVQKDVRNRVKHSVFNYILYESIIHQRDRLKVVHHKKFEAIIPYDVIEEKYNAYNLADIYNLVFFDRNSQYIVNQLKMLSVSEVDIANLDSKKRICSDSDTLAKYKVNMGDSIILVNQDEDTIIRPNVYLINKITSDTGGMVLDVNMQEAVNMERSSEIINSMKG